MGGWQRGALCWPGDTTGREAHLQQTQTRCCSYCHLPKAHPGCEASQEESLTASKRKQRAKLLLVWLQGIL